MSLFEPRLVAEGVRVVEEESSILSTYSANAKEADFELLLLERAATHPQNSIISALFLHFKKLTNNVYTLFSLLLFIFGGLAVNKLLFTEQLSSVNFFWAFALFLIPNILMFFMWLVLFCKPNLLQNSSLRRVSLASLRFIERRFNKVSSLRRDYSVLFNCYFNIHFGKPLGRYQLSKLTHLLWLSYFTGATLMSILMLATHQVDFVWQTSILSSESFQSLTQLLAYLPDKIGLPTPSIEQIQQSYLGSDKLVDAENTRLAWSSLLISSLFLYGFLPRLLLFISMHSLYKQKMSSYQLDLSLPYYVQLRQQLKPNKTSLGITDVDEESTPDNRRDYAMSNEVCNGVLPACFYPIAIELSGRQFGLAKYHLQQYPEIPSDDLLNVCDYPIQQDVLVDLQGSKSRTIVIYVALNRLPDRGLKRFISQLTALPNKTFHLGMIVESQANKQRDNDWYQLADHVGIELDNILHIEVEGDKHE